MPNHYHLQMEVGTQPGLSAAMHSHNTGYGIRFNRRFGRTGALFQGRFKSILFDPDECLLAIHYYIHLNPVRIVKLKEAEKQPERMDKSLLLAKRREVLRDYEWSSYRDYAGIRSGPPWLTVEAVRECSGLSARKYRQELDRRITDGLLGLGWQGELAAGILMGGQEVGGIWKRFLAERTGGNRKNETRRFGLISWEEITSAIEQEWRRPWVHLRQSRGNAARATTIWLARHRGGMTFEQVRANLGASSYSAVAILLVHRSWLPGKWSVSIKPCAES
jgi:putative transposase